MMIRESVRPTKQGVVARSFVLVGLVAAVLVGMGIAVAPLIAAAIVALVLLVPLVESPLARLTFVVTGGMAVLSVSDTLSIGKVVYFLGCGAVVAVALLRLPSLKVTRAYAEVRTVLHVSFAFSAFVFLEMVLAMLSGASPSGVLRESASYLLFAFIPLLALDARTSSRQSVIAWIFVIASLVGTLSYAVTWLTHRDLSGLSVSHVTLAGALPAALLCYLSAGFLIAHRRLLWAIAAGGVLALFLLAGNRSAVIVLLGPFAIALVAREGRWRRILRLVVVGALVAVLALITFGWVARAIGVDTSILSARYESLLHPSVLRSDPSLDVRLAQTRVAWEVFRSDPMLGAGPGYVFVWIDPSTRLSHGYPYIDSPLQLPAKLGAVGVVFWLGLVIAYGSLLVGLNRSPNIYRAAALGFAVTQVAFGLLLPPMTDKGEALGLVMLLALSLSTGKAERGPGGSELRSGRVELVPVIRHRPA